MSKIDIKSQYDVVIIGAGMGGLTASAVLSKAGYHVLVADSANQPGGYLAGFHRNRFRFDTAVHWLNQCNPGGIIHTIFESLGNDYPKVISQQRIKRYVGDNHDYLLTNKPDELKQTLQNDFPHERKGIERFFQDARQLGERMNTWGKNVRANETFSAFEKPAYWLNTLRFILPFIKHIRFTGEAGLASGLNQYFKDPGLHRLFSTEPDLLSCLVPIGWAYFSDFQNPPAGGGQAFPEWLEHLVKYFGSDIFYHTRVTEILLEGKTATGVILNHRGNIHRVKCRYVIAACDVKTLYEKMLPERAIPKLLIERLNKAELYGSSFTISVALDCDPATLGFGEEAIHISKQSITRQQQMAADAETSEIIVLAPSCRDKTMAPEGQGVITIFMPAEIHQHNHWETTIDSEGNAIRGEAYKQLKIKLADTLLQRVEEKVAPDLRKHVLFYEVATPYTHQRYTGNRNGTMMGARPGKANMKSGVAHYRTPVKNLILGGHWAELGGGVPIAVKAGFNAALLILKDEQPSIMKLYRDYINRKTTAENLRTNKQMKCYPNNWQRKPTPAELLAIRRSTKQVSD